MIKAYRHLLFSAVIGSVLASQAPAYAVDEATLLNAAKKEGRATLYTSGDPGITASVVAGFKKKYGLDIDVQRLTSGALGQRFMAEAETKAYNADIVLTFDKVFLNQVAEKKLLASVGDLPEVASWPKAAVYRDNLGYNVSPDIYNLSWNTNLVKTEPTSWKELVDPKWKSLVMLSDPRVIGGPTRGWFWLMRKTYGDDYLRQLGKQATYSPSSVPGTQQLAAGVVALYAPSTSSGPAEMIAKGAPIQSKAPSDVTLQYEAFAVVAANAPHPNVARLMLNYWMSPEGQNAYNNGRYSVRSDAPGTTQVPKNAVVYDEVASEAQLSEILKLLGIQ